MWYLQLMHADSNRVTVQLSPVCGNNLLPLRRCVCFSQSRLFPWSVHFTWVYINIKIYIYMLRERHSLFWNVCSVEGEQILSRMLCRLHSASSFMNKKGKKMNLQNWAPRREAAYDTCQNKPHPRLSVWAHTSVASWCSSALSGRTSPSGGGVLRTCPDCLPPDEQDVCRAVVCWSRRPFPPITSPGSVFSDLSFFCSARIIYKHKSKKCRTPCESQNVIIMYDINLFMVLQSHQFIWF